GTLQPWKHRPEAPAHRTHVGRSPRAGPRAQPPGACPCSAVPGRGLSLPVEEGDGQAVELLVGALGHDPVHHLGRGVVPQPLGDGLTHGLAVTGERRREHLHSGEGSACHAPTFLHPKPRSEQRYWKATANVPFERGRRPLLGSLARYRPGEGRAGSGRTPPRRTGRSGASAAAVRLAAAPRSPWPAPACSSRHPWSS